MTRELTLMPNGCILWGPEKRDKKGNLLPRPIVVRLVYANDDTSRLILNTLRNETKQGPIMSDASRMARLTALARKVWPGYGDELYVSRDSVCTGHGHTLLAVDHPRALDALDVALQELADNETK